jgi:hypothetical protein
LPEYFRNSFAQEDSAEFGRVLLSEIEMQGLKLIISVQKHTLQLINDNSNLIK